MLDDVSFSEAPFSKFMLLPDQANPKVVLSQVLAEGLSWMPMRWNRLRSLSRSLVAMPTKAFVHEYARCHKQTSVTAGTLIHGSKHSLTVWFWAAYLMTTHANGLSALQLQKQLGLGSYKSAWYL